MNHFSACRRVLPALAFAGLATSLATGAHATGDWDVPAVPTLPYYLGRLPGKSPSQVFFETAPGAQGSFAAAVPTDYKTALAALAKDAEQTPPAALLTRVDSLLAQARLDPKQSGPLCNLFNDLHDLFAAGPPVPGKDAASYIRFRAEHADWFGLKLVPPKEGGPTPAPADDSDDIDKAKADHIDGLKKRAAAKGPLRVHWLYLAAALSYPGDGSADLFRSVIKEFPDHPRAESARFMLGRWQLVAVRSLERDNAPDPTRSAVGEKAARELFEDYLKHYPKGRFAADAKGWLGAVAFDSGNDLAALKLYLEQTTLATGQPAMLKSAAFMCERCLSHLSAKGDDTALSEIAAHPPLAMSLLYLIINTGENQNEDSKLDPPASVAKWRKDLLPRLAKEVAAHESAYKDPTAGPWQARYLAILAQAASGVGDQARALSLCAMAGPEIDRSDDLAFIRLTALQRAHRLPEAIAAGLAFAEHFPKSPLRRGAALRTALAYQDNHQAGRAVVELTRLRDSVTKKKSAERDDLYYDEADDNFDPADHLARELDSPGLYPYADADLDAARSVLRHDTSGAEHDEVAQLIDTLLNFAPLPELLPALAEDKNLADPSVLVTWRAVLVQRYLAEQENFAEAKKYATPAQWNLAAAAIEKLAAFTTPRPLNAEAALRLADAWAAARGRLVFSPLETDATRDALFRGEAAQAGLNRRANGHALGYPAEAVDHALESRDEMRHALAWWLLAADAAPAGSPTRARALWSALKALPGIAFASPFAFARADETELAASSRKLYDRLRKECPDSRETKEFAVYYEFPDAPSDDEDNEDDAPVPSPSPASATPEPETEPVADETSEDDPSTYQPQRLNGEPEYRYDAPCPDDTAGDSSGSQDGDGVDLKRVLALVQPRFTSDPKLMAREVAALRKEFHAAEFGRYATGLLNLLDDLDDLLKEPSAKLIPEALKYYVGLRIECLSVENWGGRYDGLPSIPGLKQEAIESADDGDPLDPTAKIPAPKALGSGRGVDDAVFNHIRAAYKAPGMAALKDYLDFLALAVIANHRVVVTGTPHEAGIPEALDKDGQGTYMTRDYPLLARLAEGFLTEHPRSGKREAVRLLYARGLYNASRPALYYKYAAWPENKHFQGGNIVAEHRLEPFDARKIGAALNDYDREFPHGRYAAEIRNLRALLAWRTQDWDIALDLTLAALTDKKAPDLRETARLRLVNIFVDGLTDETERRRLLTAIKARPPAAKQLRDYLPKSDWSLRVIKGWIEEEL